VKAKTTATTPNGKKKKIAPTKDDVICVLAAEVIAQP
jgi:hypothetical protein